MTARTTHHAGRVPRRWLAIGSMVLGIAAGCGGATAPSADGPHLSALSPSSAPAGQLNEFVIISGERFLPGSSALWNGHQLPTEFLDEHQLLATLADAELRRPGIGLITVDDGSGGISNALKFSVAYPRPTITSVAPAEIRAGSGEVRLTITGGLFFGATRGSWNGAVRPTVLLDPGTIEVVLSAGDVNTPQVGELTVVNPSPGGASAPFLVPITREQRITAQRVVAVQVNALLVDPTRQVIIGAVSSGDLNTPDAIAEIDPIAARVTRTIALPFEPLFLALSADGHYLYTAPDSAPVVARIDLITSQIDLTFRVDGFAIFEPSAVGGIAVVPGEPRAVVVAIRSRVVSPNLEGYVVFADGVPRANRLSRALRSNFVLSGISPGEVLGFGDPQAGPFTLIRLGVNNSGVSITSQQSYPGVTGIESVVDNGRLILDSGTDIDLATGNVRGSLGLEPGSFASDVAAARFYKLLPVSHEIGAYDMQQFVSIGSVNIPGIGTPQGSLVRWSRGGLAFRTVTQVIIVETTLSDP
jgi:hypothetical protein